MWWIVAALVVALIAAVAYRPKPQTKNVMPDAVEVPVAEEGKELTVLFGTRVIDDPTVAWYGNLRTEAIKR